jgi:hypothetical protein
MQDQVRGAGSELPRRRPGQLIAGVMKDHGATQSTVDELNTLGFSEDSIFVLYGERGAESLRHRGEGAGFLRWVWGRFVEFAGAGDDFVRRHIEAADEGKYLIGVELRSDERRTQDRVQHVLKSHGGHDIIRVGGGYSEEMIDARPPLFDG